MSGSGDDAPQARLHLGITPWVQRRANHGEVSLAEQAQRAEDYGYDSFWLPERHLSRGAYPAPLLELAAVAARTSRLVLGTTSYLLPIRDPILVAEEVAVLDRISQGRLILGLGRGFRKELFEVFGVSPAEKRARFENSLRRMVDAWCGEPIDAEGRLRLSPRPLQQPHPPIWVAAFGPKALQQAGRLGLPYLASPMETLDRLRANQAVHRNALRGSGDTSQPVPVMRTLLVTDDASVVRQARRAAVLENQGFLDLVPNDGQTASGQHAILGTASEVLLEIERYRQRLGMTHLIVRAGPGDVDDQVLEESVRALPRLLGRAPSAR